MKRRDIAALVVLGAIAVAAEWWMLTHDWITP
mgnify:CR=1 FL=1